MSTRDAGAPGSLGHLDGAARVLVVTDQPVLAQVIGLTLHHGQFQVNVATTVAAATARLAQGDAHLVVLDMDVEALGSERVLEAIGDEDQRVARVPVIALTRRGDLRTKLAAFDHGVDDILTVPFSPEELLARTLVVLRRTYRQAVAFAPVVRVGELAIDIVHRRVRAGTSDLHLTPLEQSLLYLLAANAGRVLTRDEIMDHLWGTDYIADSNVVDRHVRNLRAKLQNDWRRPRYVITVPGRGYRFVPADPPPAEGPASPDLPATPETRAPSRPLERPAGPV